MSEVEIGMENGQVVKETIKIPKQTGPVLVVTGRYLVAQWVRTVLVIHSIHCI
jgi:hypothetical protein